jgi:hypothetical protein
MDYDELPEWAMEYPDVIWLCARDVPFRFDVLCAEDEDERDYLINLAESVRIYHIPRGE